MRVGASPPISGAGADRCRGPGDQRIPPITTPSDIAGGGVARVDTAYLGLGSAWIHRNPCLSAPMTSVTCILLVHVGSI